METESGRAFSVGRRSGRIARWIVIVVGLMCAAGVAAAIGGLLPPGSEPVLSAPFRW